MSQVSGKLCLNIVVLHRYQMVSGSSRTCSERLVPPMVNKMGGRCGKQSIYVQSKRSNIGLFGQSFYYKPFVLQKDVK